MTDYQKPLEPQTILSVQALLLKALHIATLMLGKIEGRRRTTEDEMVGWHHQLDGHGFG